MITVSFSGENAADIAKQIAAFGGPAKSTVPEAKPAAKKPKVEDDIDEDLDGEDAAEISAEDVRAAVKKAVTADASNRDKVKDLLKKFKAKNVTTLDPKHYSAMVEALTELGEEL